MEKIIINEDFKNWLTPLTFQEIDNLKQSILTEGCRDALILWNGILIDGHNRYKICIENDIPYTTITKDFADKNEVLKWIDSNQLSRRNLTDEQRSFLYGRLSKINKQEGFKGNKYTNVVRDKMSLTTNQQSVAEDLGISTKTLQRDEQYTDAVEKIATTFGTDFKNKILAGQSNLTKQDTIAVSKMEPEKQQSIIDKIETGVAKNLKEAQHKEKIEEKKFEVLSMPDGIYDLVYCDPPWRYDFAETNNRQIENQYPTMSVEDICNMKLPILNDNCLLLMWATAPKLLEAIKVIDAWGFTYKTHAIWDKNIQGMGYWFRGQHELLLVATKGKYSPPEPEFRNSSVYTEQRTKHSTKPIYYYEWIEQAFKYSKKIELFSRNKRSEWEVWGNE